MTPPSTPFGNWSDSIAWDLDHPALFVSRATAECTVLYSLPCLDQQQLWVMALSCQRVWSIGRCRPHSVWVMSTKPERRQKQVSTILQRSRKVVMCLCLTTVTLVSWHTLMLAKPRLPNVFCTILVKHIRLVKCTKAQPPWIGWNKSKSVVLPLLLPLLLVHGKTNVSTSLIHQVTSISPLK